MYLTSYERRAYTLNPCRSSAGSSASAGVNVIRYRKLSVCKLGKRNSLNRVVSLADKLQWWQVGCTLRRSCVDMITVSGTETSIAFSCKCSFHKMYGGTAVALRLLMAEHAGILAVARYPSSLDILQNLQLRVPRQSPYTCTQSYRFKSSVEMVSVS